MRDFDEIDLPNLAVTETNPAARLDFRRFASEQVAAYDRMQVEILRKHSPGRFITHNFMGFFREFDHWAFDHLDLASWDSYPLGFVEHFPFSEAERERWALTSHPDIAAFHHDLYRGVGRGRFWVMEQQPGPVNWASWNPVPHPGMVRLWTWEAFAHGAEVVSYFRWRQAPFAQEQMHAGLNRPDRTLSPGGKEATQVARELESRRTASGHAAGARRTRFRLRGLVDHGHPTARTRLLVWRTRLPLVRRPPPVSALTSTSFRPANPLQGYRAVVVPSLPHISEAALAAFQAIGSPDPVRAALGIEDPPLRIPPELPPGPLQALLPLKVIQVASLGQA